MSKYVNAAYAAEKIAEKHGIPIADLCDTFGDIPAADVIEKKHGYWIKRIIENEEEDYPIRNVNYICSQCEGCWHEPLKYCPMCLAEMDKEE